MYKLIQRLKRRLLKRRLRKQLYERLNLNQKVYDVSFLHRPNENLDALCWGRSLAQRAHILAADITYQQGCFCFIVYEDSLPTDQELYRLRALAFYDDYLCAPYTIGRVRSYRLNATSKFVVYTLHIIQVCQRA